MNSITTLAPPLLLLLQGFPQFLIDYAFVISLPTQLKYLLQAAGSPVQRVQFHPSNFNKASIAPINFSAPLAINVRIFKICTHRFESVAEALCYLCVYLYCTEDLTVTRFYECNVHVRNLRRGVYQFRGSCPIGFERIIITTRCLSGAVFICLFWDQFLHRHVKSNRECHDKEDIHE